MTILDCPNCGGTHYGSNKCPFTEASCVVCGSMTVFACSDCAIDSGGARSVHVCQKRECRDAHEAACHAKLKRAERLGGFGSSSPRDDLKDDPLELSLQQYTDTNIAQWHGRRRDGVNWWPIGPALKIVEDAGAST